MADTLTITTPITKTEVVLKKWITGADDESIQSVIEDALSVDADTTGAGKANINGSVVRAMRHKALECVVVSVAGEESDVVERLRQLPAADYKFVCTEVDQVTEGATPEKKA